MAKNVLVRGISNIRKSILLQPIAIVLILVSFSLAIDAPGDSIRTWVALIIIGSVIGIISMFLMRSGFKILECSNKKYWVGATGTIFQIIGLFLCLVVFLYGLVGTYTALPNLVPQTPTSSAVILSSIGLLVLIGAIFEMIGFWRIGSEYDNDLVKAGAVLYIFVGILVDLVLLYIGLGSIEKKLSK